MELDDSAAETQTLMDLDLPTDAGLVKSLIEEATTKATKKISSELGKVKKELEELRVKESRGKTASASEKKEKERQRKLKKKKERSSNEADASLNDSTKEKKKKSKRRNGKQQKKNQRK